MKFKEKIACSVVSRFIDKSGKTSKYFNSHYGLPINGSIEDIKSKVDYFKKSHFNKFLKFDTDKDQLSLNLAYNDDLKNYVHYTKIEVYYVDENNKLQKPIFVYHCTNAKTTEDMKKCCPFYIENPDNYTALIIHDSCISNVLRFETKKLIDINSLYYYIELENNHEFIEIFSKFYKESKFPGIPFKTYILPDCEIIETK